jgi:hypothetical protein
MARINLSVEQWPLVVTTMVNDISDAEYETYLSDFEARVIARREPFASLVDASRQTKAPTATQRQRLVTWQRENAPISIPYVVCVAMVIDNAIVRGAMTALHWVFPPQSPTKIVARYEDALAYCVESLRAAGHPTEHLRAAAPTTTTKSVG